MSGDVQHSNIYIEIYIRIEKQVCAFLMMCKEKKNNILNALKAYWNQ